MTWDDVQDLQRGFSRMKFEEFAAILKGSIDAGEDYARNCWPRFKDNPLGYCLSRSPDVQGRVLIEFAYSKGLLTCTKAGDKTWCTGCSAEALDLDLVDEALEEVLGQG